MQKKRRRNFYMIRILILFIVLAAAVPDDIDGMWRDWKVKYNKQYKERSTEDAKRSTFAANVRTVREWNEANMSSTMELNALADMSHEEYLSMLTFVPPVASRVNRQQRPMLAAAALPESIDYRTRGWVGPVRDQGRCGCCWAVSMADACAGVRAMAGEPYMDLSVRQLVECSSENFGCAGGDTVTAAEYVIRYGLMAEAAYPFAIATGQCHYRSAAATARFNGYVLLPEGDEQALARALIAHGPLSVALNASPSSFQLYGGGILNDRSCSGRMSALNHAVILIGMTPTYWILKNSWNVSWGIQGYLLLARGSNQCGVATYSLYITK
jgi:cathepsin L